MGVASGSSSAAEGATVAVAVADADDFLRSLVFLLGACNGVHSSSTLIIVGVSSATVTAVVWTTPDGKENVGITIHLFNIYVYTLSGGCITDKRT